MRNQDERLKKCPTCNSELDSNSDLGFRSYDWINRRLPGRIGCGDIDLLLRRNDNELLVAEFKPFNAVVPLGQRLSLKALALKGISVLIVWDRDRSSNKSSKDNRVQISGMKTNGELTPKRRLTVHELGTEIVEWWQEAA
jgi:hypothetical protein